MALPKADCTTCINSCARRTRSDWLPNELRDLRLKQYGRTTARRSPSGVWACKHLHADRAGLLWPRHMTSSGAIRTASAATTQAAPQQTSGTTAVENTGRTDLKPKVLAVYVRRSGPFAALDFAAVISACPASIEHGVRQGPLPFRKSFTYPFLGLPTLGIYRPRPG